MLELFASETYRAVIDSVARIDHSGDDFVEVRGWAGDFLRKIAWGLEVPALEPAALRRATRQDISTVYGFSLNEKLGFTLRVPKGLFIDSGTHLVRYSVKNVLAFGDFRINVALQTSDSRRIVAENACRFHIKGFATEVMPVINPEVSVDIR